MILLSRKSPDVAGAEHAGLVSEQGNLPATAVAGLAISPSSSNVVGLEPVRPTLRTNSGAFPHQGSVWLERHYKPVLFALIVVVPTVLAAIYYVLIATPQYVTNFRMGVSPADPSTVSSQSGVGSPLSSGSNTLSATMLGVQSYVVTQFMTSREMADALDAKISLRQRFSAPNIDFLSRLAPNAPAENFAEYWAGKIDAFFDLTTGSIDVKVRAFTPQDSLAISKAAISLAQGRVSDTRDAARHDSLQGAEADVVRAEERVTKARLALQDIRNSEGMFNPSLRVLAVSTTADKLRDDIAQLQAQLKSMTGLMSSEAPTVQIMKNRIAAEQEQLRQEEARIASAPSHGSAKDTLSDVSTRFDQASSEEKFAEQAYQDALQSLNVARALANRQQMFLIEYVKPMLPQISLSPDKTTSVITIFSFSFIAWFICIMLVASVRDHML